MLASRAVSVGKAGQSVLASRAVSVGIAGQSVLAKQGSQCWQSRAGHSRAVSVG